MSAFIHGMGMISAQPSFGNFPLKQQSILGSKLVCIEPDYAEWIDAKSIRRMSKIIRISVASAKLALKEAGIEKPDAIVTGTGLGCLEDTETFLMKLIGNREEALNPTPFIQSTHNTMGSQIALITQCLGYNQTFTHRAFSVELALEDAMMLLEENPAQNILAGCADEVTDLSMDIFKKLDWVTDCENSLLLFNQNNCGTIHGEGGAFLCLTEKGENAWAEIVGVKMGYKPANSSDVLSQLDELLNHSGVERKDVDLFLTGKCGDQRYDWLMDEVIRSMNAQEKQAPFKHLCGEYSTASSFAVWLAVTIFKSKVMPHELQGLQNFADNPVRTILIYNQYFNQHHTFILFKGMLRNRIHNIVFFVVAIGALVGYWVFGLTWWVFAPILILSFAIKLYASFTIQSKYFIRTLCKGPGNSGSIAITFDDGPIAGKTDKILDALKDKNVPAAFFCIGNMIDNCSALIKRINAEGHVIGNHSFYHQKFFPLKNSESITEELLKTDDAVSALIGKRPRLFRPPYGVTNPIVALAVRRTRHETIGWSVRSFDTVLKNKKRLWNRITKDIQSGDIVLFHDYSDLTIELLPAFIDHIRKSGLKIVRLDELLGIEAYA